MTECSVSFTVVPSWHATCRLPSGHYGPHAAFLNDCKVEWPNPETPAHEDWNRAPRLATGPDGQPLTSAELDDGRTPPPLDTGRLPALDALLQQWRNRFQNPTFDAAAWGAFLMCADELEIVLAGLRADPAPRQVLEGEK